LGTIDSRNFFFDVLKSRLFLTTDPGGDQQRGLRGAVQPAPPQEETLHRLREEVAAVPRQLQQVHHWGGRHHLRQALQGMLRTSSLSFSKIFIFLCSLIVWNLLGITAGLRAELRIRIQSGSRGLMTKSWRKKI
jgi:hypothetical protein